MRIKTNKEIARIFRLFADRVEDGTCGTDPATLTAVANTMIHIKMTAEETCSYLGVSRATLSRMVIDGRVPHPHKDRGGNKFWYQDEVDDYIAEYNEKNGLN